MPAAVVMTEKSELSSNDETLDTPTSELSSAAGSACHHVGFMQGSRPQLATETASLLRTRLRAAAGVLFLAFGAFFVWRLTNPYNDNLAESFSFYSHFAVTVVLGAALVLLCRTCAIHLKILRVYELVIFGMPAAYFLVQQYDSAAELTRNGILVSPLPYWLGLVFTYGMFIPNTCAARRSWWARYARCLSCWPSCCIGSTRNTLTPSGGTPAS